MAKRWHSMLRKSHTNAYPEWKCPVCLVSYPHDDWIKTKLKGWYICPNPTCKSHTTTGQEEIHLE